MDIPTSVSPHGREPCAVFGDTESPTRALILVHGRGGTAKNMLSIVDALLLPAHTIVLVPQAAGHTWYPNRFHVPQRDNQPDLDAALERILTLITYVKMRWQISSEQVILAGFSQGGCLVAEYLKRHPQPYHAAAIWSGGLIGTDDEVQEVVLGSLRNTPVYLGCDVADMHIPLTRVEATANYLQMHGAALILETYHHFGHAIHPNGLAFLSTQLAL